MQHKKGSRNTASPTAAAEAHSWAWQVQLKGGRTTKPMVRDSNHAHTSGGRCFAAPERLLFTKLAMKMLSQSANAFCVEQRSQWLRNPLGGSDGLWAKCPKLRNTACCLIYVKYASSTVWRLLRLPNAYMPCDPSPPLNMFCTTYTAERVLAEGGFVVHRTCAGAYVCVEWGEYWREGGREGGREGIVHEWI
jgi:hypothetical protein